MKAKKRLYICMVGCGQIRRRRNYVVKNTRSGRAWRKAFDKFCAEFPQVLTRGLTAGGDVLVLRRWSKLHCEALAARR